jgi:hypothetical protein
MAQREIAPNQNAMIATDFKSERITNKFQENQGSTMIGRMLKTSYSSKQKYLIVHSLFSKFHPL